MKTMPKAFRARRSLADQRGLTLIELLLSLTLLVVLTGFLAGGLQLARRAVDADRRALARAEVDSTVRVLSDQIARAFPAKDAKSGKLDFDGRGNTFAFTGLDAGHASRAGLQRTSIQTAASDLTIDVTPPRPEGQGEQGVRANCIVLLSRVAHLRFRYFGQLSDNAAPGWISEWRNAERLPQLVSLEIMFEDTRQPPISVIVALPQRT